MSSCRLINRSLAILVGVLTSCPICSSDAHAGCMDWLFGRKTPAYTYQTVGPPVVTTGPITTTPVPTTVTPVPMTTTPVPAGNAPALQGPVAPVAPVGPSPVSLSPGITASPGVVTSQRPAYTLQQPAYVQPAYAAQRPAFGVPTTTSVQTFENPNVYSGLPTNTALPTVNASALPPQGYGYSAQRLPIVSRRLPAAGVAIPPNPQTVYRPQVTTPLPYIPPSVTANRVPIATTLRGTAGMNPISASPVYTSNYASGVAPVTYNAAPTPAPTTSFGTGLSRFFSSPLGSNTTYNTSYYRAPITYYRPMTSVDPATGTTVTVQRPCTSYVQQLRRVPYNSFLPTNQPVAAPAPTAAPTQNCVPACPDVCAAPSAMPIPSAPATIAPIAPATIAPPIGGIGQVGGQALPGSQTVSPIPSTIPPSGYSGQGTPNTMPLTGSPPSGSEPNDNQTIAPPQLEAGRAPLTESPAPASDEAEPDAKASESYGDDVYPYGRPDAQSNGSEKESSDTKNAPAIQLDPPVSDQSRVTSPSGRFSLGQQLTSQTPPSFQQSGVAPLPIDQQYSTLKPIGVTATEPTTTSPLLDLPPPPVSSGNAVQQPSDDALQPPPLPAPSTRGTSPSSLFRNTESSASVRTASPDRVSVPIREATTRQQSIQQVGRWEAVQPVTRQFAPQPFPPSRPAPVVRDNSGWIPAP